MRLAILADSVSGWTESPSRASATYSSSDDPGSVRWATATVVPCSMPEGTWPSFTAISFRLQKQIEQCHAIPGIQIVLLIKLVGVGLRVGHIVIAFGYQVPCPRRQKLLGLRLQAKQSGLAHRFTKATGAFSGSARLTAFHGSIFTSSSVMVFRFLVFLASKSNIFVIARASK